MSDVKKTGPGSRLAKIDENKRLGIGQSKAAKAARARERERNGGARSGRSGYELVRAPCIACEKVVWCRKSGVRVYTPEFGALDDGGWDTKAIMDEMIEDDYGEAMYRTEIWPVCNDCIDRFNAVRTSKGWGEWGLREVILNIEE